VGIDWGSVPDAVGSLLTGASFVVAALAYRRSVADKESTQAGLVCAWFELDDDDVLVLRVRNGAQQAIYEVVVLLPTTSEEIDLKSIPPESTATRIVNIASGVRGPAPVRFRDGVGRYWRRDGDGVLTNFGGPELSLKNAKRYKLVR
jgi:hypothetical protein